MCFSAVLVNFVWHIVIIYYTPNYNNYTNEIRANHSYHVENVNNVNIVLNAHYTRAHIIRTLTNRPVTEESSWRSFDEYCIGIIWYYVYAMKTNSHKHHTHTDTRAYVEAIGKKEKTVNHNFLPRFGIYTKWKKKKSYHRYI